jgi:hypothetical protein
MPRACSILLRICCCSSWCGKALLGDGARLRRVLLRHFELGAHADAGQFAQLLPLRGLVLARAALAASSCSSGLHRIDGAALDRLLARARFDDAAIQFDLARRGSPGRARRSSATAGAVQARVLAQLGAAVAQARLLFLAADAVPFLLAVQLVELLRVFEHARAARRRPATGCRCGAVGVELVVAQRDGVDPRHGQPVLGQQQRQPALQVLVEFQAQFALPAMSRSERAATNSGPAGAPAGSSSSRSCTSLIVPGMVMKVAREGRHVLDLQD